jgi:dihydroorotate dehydrogenase
MGYLRSLCLPVVTMPVLKMSEIDLTAQLGSVLRLQDPFWVASAHYSENEPILETWAEIQPAALTLKTSHRAPIDQTDSRSIRRKTTDFTDRLSRSYYCDGPKKKELLTYERAAELLKYARSKLPSTKVGISVICNKEQDYDEFLSLCPNADFCELNLKYIFRFDKAEVPKYFDLASQRFEEMLGEVRRFVRAFAELPVFIKMSRELGWLPGTNELDKFLDILSGHGRAGIIVANSLKMDVPIFVSDGQERVLQGGVVCGEALFDQTVSLIDGFRNSCANRGIPIVATGGMIDPQHMLMALRAGASAVQLCTAFAYYQPNYYNTLRWNLQNRIELLGLRDFGEFLSRLRKDSVATVYNMPFMYFDQFWAPDIQMRLQKDVRSSERMDVFLMSGRTVSERWEEALKNRFGKNLGLRLLHPDPDGPTFAAIQAAWGIVEPEVTGTKDRVRQAHSGFEKAWKDAEKDREKSRRDEPEAKFEIFPTNKCPFYSFYIFDDKVCVSPYPFIRPGEPNIPVYIFFAGSPEYERISREADTLFEYAKQSKSTSP